MSEEGNWLIEMPLKQYIGYLTSKCAKTTKSDDFHIREYRIFDDSEVVRAKPTRKIKVQVQPKPARKKAVYTKVCKVCGKEFQATYPNQNICSDECRRKSINESKIEWYRSHKDESRNIKICPVCGKEFKAQRTSTVCCCEKCSKRYYLMRHPEKSSKAAYKPKEKVEKLCPVCGKTFLAKRKSMKFCSLDCYEMNRRALGRSYYTKKRLGRL